MGFSAFGRATHLRAVVAMRCEGFFKLRLVLEQIKYALIEDIGTVLIAAK